jgi:hypothetical protein
VKTLTAHQPSSPRGKPPRAASAALGAGAAPSLLGGRARAAQAGAEPAPAMPGMGAEAAPSSQGAG